MTWRQMVIPRKDLDSPGAMQENLRAIETWGRVSNRRKPRAAFSWSGDTWTSSSSYRVFEWDSQVFNTDDKVIKVNPESVTSNWYSGSHIWAADKSLLLTPGIYRWACHVYLGRTITAAEAFALDIGLDAIRDPSRLDPILGDPLFTYDWQTSQYPGGLVISGGFTTLPHMDQDGNKIEDHEFGLVFMNNTGSTFTNVVGAFWLMNLGEADAA